MHACETMGGANYICTDKTGTLTKNEMNIYKFLTAKKEITFKETLDYENAGNLSQKKGNETIERKMREDYNIYFKNQKFWDTLKSSLAVNVEGSIKHLESPNINGDIEECETKNKTDKAFIDFLYRLKASISKEKNTYLADKKNYQQIPFDSKRKRMTTFIKNSNFPTGYRLYTKGGAEKVKNICKFYLDPDTGENLPLGDQQLNFITDTIESFN